MMKLILALCVTIIVCGANPAPQYYNLQLVENVQYIEDDIVPSKSTRDYLEGVELHHMVPLLPYIEKATNRTRDNQVLLEQLTSSLESTKKTGGNSTAV